MRIAYFANETPWPTRHGGRVDTWTRMAAMQAAGAKLHLVSWYSPSDAPLPASTMQALGSVTEGSSLFVIRPSWPERFRRLINLRRWPSHVSSRVPVGRELADFWAAMDAFRPEAVWLDALYGTVLAQACAQRFSIPLFYRSHNIEHRYMAGQVSRATGWRDRLAWSMNLPHLRAIEFATLRAARTCYDISIDDMHWWQQQGMSHMAWLPPSVAPQLAQRLSAPLTQAPAFDVGYLGNLNTPNNVEGVLWFIHEVWPQVLNRRPGTTMQLAGSKPAEAIRTAAAQAPGLTLIENAPDAVDIWRNARVLVNPVFGGSGVNIKSVEMLFAPGHRVSTTQGLSGLPDTIRQCFHVANEAAMFAGHVVSLLDASQAQPPEDIQWLAQARAEFGQHRIVAVLDHIATTCQKPGARVPQTS